MRLLLAAWLSLVLGFMPHLPALAASEPGCPGCCGCNCGVQPTPRPIQAPGAPAVSTEARAEKQKLPSLERTEDVAQFFPERAPAARPASFPPPAVPLFQRYCALLI